MWWRSFFAFRWFVLRYPGRRLFNAPVGSGAMGRRDLIRSLQGSHRYGVVLVAMVIPITYSLAVPDKMGWNRAFTVVLFGAAIMISLIVAQARPRVQRTAAILLVVVVVTAVLDAITGSKALGGLSRGIVGFMIALAPLTLARGVTRHLRQEGRVTLDAVFGAVAIYLMLGAMFASIDAAVGALSPSGFFAQSENPSFETYLYFSYTTLATVGYGDFTPGPSLARALSITEALAGQLYLVTVVAVLVSNIGRRRGGPGGKMVSEEEAPDPPPRRP